MCSQSNCWPKSIASHLRRRPGNLAASSEVLHCRSDRLLAHPLSAEMCFRAQVKFIAFIIYYILEDTEEILAIPQVPDPRSSFNATTLLPCWHLVDFSRHALCRHLNGPWGRSQGTVCLIRAVESWWRWRSRARIWRRSP